MSIGKKIISGYAVVLALMFVAVVTGFYTISIMQDTYSEFTDLDLKLIVGSNTLKFEVRDQVAHYRAVLLYPDAEKNYLDDLQTDYQQFDATIQNMRELLLSKEQHKETLEERLNLLNEIESLQAKHKQAQGKVIAMVKQGNRTEAIALGITEVRPLTQELISKTDRFNELQAKTMAQAQDDVAATANRLSVVRSLALIIAIISGLVIGFYITRSITRQLRDAIARLSASSAEILATTTQLASSASETATAVSETTATTEEVKQTSQLSGDKAKHVMESAQKAASVAQQGKDAVAQNVDAINKIKGQAELVAESIVKLSEQTQAIGEITTSVNDLAEQSNLLAVNAAIEAAKAGEQGKGFAVVAQEIRSLAEQSKQATAQVRAILTDIQKAANAAVMATEQAGKAVGAGVKQAAVAGESIGNLADTVMEASQAATQVAASSQQQLVGIDQIASAMENIKQATQQNVAGAKQAEKAAQDLNELGLKLKEIAGGSKV